MEKNPCAEWLAMMRQACKTGTLDAHHAAQLEKEAAQAGCRRADMVEHKDHKDLFKQAGAQSECPYMYAVRRGFPLYNYQKCHYTKFFDKK